MSVDGREKMEREIALYLAHEVCGYPREEAEIQASTTPFPEQAKDIVDMILAWTEVPKLEGYALEVVGRAEQCRGHVPEYLQEAINTLDLAASWSYEPPADNSSWPTGEGEM